MQPYYMTTWVEDVLIIRMQRELSLNELLTMIDEVACIETSLRLWDLTPGFNFSTQEIRQIAEQGKSRWPGNSKAAFIAPDDLGYGLIRMYEVFREDAGHETMVFRTEREALNWLLSRPTG